MAKESAWVGLSEAAQILQVHPATVRSWADRGELPSQRTPGGHRRFKRSDLMQWLENQRSSSSTEAQLLVQSAMGRARIEIGGGHMAQASWYAHLDDQARATMGLLGRQMMESLESYLSSPDGTLDEARDVGIRYAQAIRGQGLSLMQATEGFFTFNDFVLDAMLRMAEVSRPGLSRGDAVRKIYAFTRTVMLALIEAYQNN